MKEILIKSKERVAERGEVFTPFWIVKDMLDLVKPETKKLDSTFLEPVCGNGNFLVEILRRKLAVAKGRWDVIRAFASLYGIDIAADNVAEARERMLKAAWEAVPELGGACFDAKRILRQNIVVGDFINAPEKIIFYRYDLSEAGQIKQSTFVLADLLAQTQRDIFS